MKTNTINKQPSTPEPAPVLTSAETETSTQPADIGADEISQAGAVVVNISPAVAMVRPLPPELPEPAAPFVVVIRRDDGGAVINGNFPFRESSGPVTLPPRPGSVAADFLDAGARLRAMF